ncbi:hypothetical protein GLAREA_10732 [Glarea lozoyensis ATCC 20868]|uniref:Uncharacterized protein n=1 Tax=Glarea lozoyensis (strain ATCC 20868 / MF5171) TaxID=1116229 RepID=S3D979_GLAL2|nr:uncharacterized protein GLAREA_10732 [Glarea lozoyensis ATCC 20868]EPE35037.1 hypothetical protein GLAREA_10732 [Glarea lozoyensis ATCC 20868]
MMGCSQNQIEKVQELLKFSEKGIKHSLLMIGICAELHLDRLTTLVGKYKAKCKEAIELINPSNTETILEEHSNTEKEETHLDGPRREITWDFIEKVRFNRDQSKRAEEEVRATQRQLEKALPKGFLQQTYQFSDRDSDDVVTQAFADRFADIFVEFEGLIADCRIAVDGMEFTADMIRNELARQETKSSGHETKISAFIAFIAMLYLPMTTMATIFAMPVFQFPHRWRDWQYNLVEIHDASSGSNKSDLPVFSGYFWWYLGTSSAFTLLTVEGWWRFTSREVEKRQGKHWTLYLLAKFWQRLVQSWRKFNAAKAKTTDDSDDSNSSNEHSVDLRIPTTVTSNEASGSQAAIPFTNIMRNRSATSTLLQVNSSQPSQEPQTLSITSHSSETSQRIPTPTVPEQVTGATELHDMGDTTALRGGEGPRFRSIYDMV